MKITPLLAAMAAAWLALAGFAWHIEFLAVYLILSAILLIFLNTGSRTTGPRYVYSKSSISTTIDSIEGLRWHFRSFF